jgi:mono/diheme cytochrome c family protein
MMVVVSNVVGNVAAQTPAAAPAANAAPAAPRVRPAAYPSRPPADPESLARGKALYGVNCNFCHGSDARGGEGGPNLLRSELVLNDKKGELIAPVVQNGRVDQGMPKFPLSLAQITDIAAYIHDFKVGGYDISRMVPPSILVGDAAAGKKYFQSTCASCHSLTGDLKGFAAKFPDPKLLQNTYIMPGGGGGFRARGPALNVPPTTVTVTEASGQSVTGKLARIDDFSVTLTLPDNTDRTFRRDGDTPRVEVHDPMQAHKDLLSRYTDQDIHNLTAYLVTVK